MPGSSLGMTPNILQRGQASSPLFFAARGRRSPLSCPGNKPRGWSAVWRNHRSTLCGARAPFAKGARPAALHRGFRRGARLQARASWDAASAPVRCLRPVPAQRAPRSAVVLPHGRGPERPGAAVTSRSSRRRILLHHPSAPRRRPRRVGHVDYIPSIVECQAFASNPDLPMKPSHARVRFKNSRRDDFSANRG